MESMNHFLGAQGDMGAAARAQGADTASAQGPAQPQGAPRADASAQARQGAYADAMGQPGQDAPQPGGYYQYVPGAGFVQVQGPAAQPGTMGAATQPGMGYDPAQAAAAQQALGMQGAGYAAQPGMGYPNMGFADPAAMAAAQQAAAQQAAAQQAAAQQAAAAQGLYGQGVPDASKAKFDQNKLGKMYGVIGDIMNGEQPDTEQLLGLFQDSDGEFWKGALVGAAAGLLLGNEAVRGAVAGTFGSMYSKVFGGEKEPQVQVTLGKDK